MRIEQLQDFYDHNPCYDVQANDSILLNKTTRDNCTFEEAASRLGQSLLIAPNFKEAWQGFLELHQEFAGVDANMSVAFRHLPEFELDPTVEMFEEIAERGLLAVSNAYNQQGSDARERQDLLQTITKGASTYWSFDKYGRRARAQSSDLENESLDSLRELAAKVTEERRLQSLPPAQMRQESKRIAEANRRPDPVRELPSHFTTLSESRWFQAGQVIEFNALNFLRCGRESQKDLLNKHGIPAIQKLIDTFKESQN